MKNNNILIAYFSISNNTEVIANYIQEELIGTMLRLQTKQHYPTAYNALTDYAKIELNENRRPELDITIDNINDYDTIFIGYPIWWYTYPMAVLTFFDKYNLSGKTLIPFATHEGSGMSGTEEAMKLYLKDVNVKKGIAIRGSNVRSSLTDVKEWLTMLEKSN